MSETKEEEIRHGKWTHLSPLPKTNYSKVFQLNDNELIAVPHPTNDPFIYKYNIGSNKWNKWIKYPSDLPVLVDVPKYSAVAMNKERNNLYICCNQLLILVNLENHETSIKYHAKKFGQEAVAIFVRNEFHIIGGDTNGNHYVYNENKQQFDLIHAFIAYYQGFSCQQLIYLQSQNALFLMGGYDDTMGAPLNDIWKYSFDDNKWKHLEDTLPDTTYRFGHTLGPNDEYIALIGDYYSDDIHILDPKTFEIKKSKISVPPNSYYINALSVTNNDRYKNLVFGYLRKECKSFDIEFPMDIIKAINKWCCSEDLYIIDTYCHEPYHWRMKLDDILDVAD